MNFYKLNNTCNQHIHTLETEHEQCSGSLAVPFPITLQAVTSVTATLTSNRRLVLPVCTSYN